MQRAGRAATSEVATSGVGVKLPKWMVKIMENPIKMDDLEVPFFLETPIFGACQRFGSSKVFFSDTYFSGALISAGRMSGVHRNLRWLHMGSGQDVLSLGGFHTSI